MTDSLKQTPTRREVLADVGKATAAATVLASAGLPGLFAGEDNTIRLALVGCGGRGTGAAENALATKMGPTKLVAMADVFTDRLNPSFKNLKRAFGNQVDVPEERKFIGFDAYRKAIDCLRAGDVVILATPPAFRWVHFQYALQKGVHVFMEKPVTVDGPTTKRFFALAEESEKRNHKVAVGLMCRHCDARRELARRVHGGQIGELILMRAYRQVGPTASAFSTPRPSSIDELEYQIRRFHSFLWASGGAFSDFLIHNLDEACWMKDAWPVKAQGSGGRHYKTSPDGRPYIDQNFDTYSVEYTYADGTKLYLEGRTMSNCHNEFATYVHGTKGAAVVSTAGHLPALSKIFKGQNMVKDEIAWEFGKPEPNPYQLEWDHFIEAIRKDQPYNETKRGLEASLASSMGRMACHTGQVITREQILNSDHEFAPDVDKLVLGGPAPLQADPDGKYPIPRPGINKKREF